MKSLQRVSNWFQLKKLQHEYRSSERFQRECERINCHALAELEQRHRSEIARKMELMKRSTTS